LKVLDIGLNKLLNVSVKSLISLPIREVDMTMNSLMKINEREYKAVRCCMWQFRWSFRYLLYDLQLSRTMFLLKSLVYFMVFVGLIFDLILYEACLFIVKLPAESRSINT